MKIDVLLNPSEINLFATQTVERPAACVVFDVLRATTSIVAALDAGAAGVRPVIEISEALACRALNPALLLAGERHGDRIDGFDLGNSPAEFDGVAGRDIVMTTTNGTVALAACAGVPHVFASSFLNMDATARAVGALRPPSLALLAAGTFETTAIEDVLAAGALCALLAPAELTDAARLALAAWESCSGDLEPLVRSSRNARALARAGRSVDIDFALRMDSVSFASALSEGVVRRVHESTKIPLNRAP